MPMTFRPYEPGRLIPLTPDMRDRIPEGHLAHQVSDDLVDEPDLPRSTRRMGATVGAMRRTGPG